MKPMELVLNEIQNHSKKVTALQVKLHQISTTLSQLEIDKANTEKELNFEAGVISSLEFVMNILQQDSTQNKQDKSET